MHRVRDAYHRIAHDTDRRATAQGPDKRRLSRVVFADGSKSIRQTGSACRCLACRIKAKQRPDSGIGRISNVEHPGNVDISTIRMRANIAGSFAITVSAAILIAQ
ncbi:hypothetical protein PHSY_005939 [Pseudozyma hubeiensis SY62]|uniref:Uncharacterized protein n=1 Tax=Pseudozyma hubeiensis (strain SY62) TaxID=1305764 RepID=R9PAG6_PSEHS|nr:hypothetical protein PHSY_005939 [Pseudozyma hubeiensis SY62]GAC98346.1 hypothetical protein PHSY_005939 [Pseudozyma hubeiensis SY62]